MPGVERTQRGSPRRITPTGIYHIALARLIACELGCNLKSSIDLAAALMRSEDPDLVVFQGLSLRFDRRAFETAIDARIAEAVESIVPARRGRPPAQDAAGR